MQSVGYVDSYGLEADQSAGQGDNYDVGHTYLPYFSGSFEEAAASIGTEDLIAYGKEEEEEVQIYLEEAEDNLELSQVVEQALGQIQGQTLLQEQEQVLVQQ